MALPLDTTLFSPGDRVLVGVSGGPDSLALLHALAQRRAEMGIELAAAHVHHGMRGEEADADSAFLERRCLDWGAPLEIVLRDVPAAARARRISVEEAGREERYAAFEELCARRGCGKVATAHTADDQAETVLLNLLRGTGTDGLAGIPRRRPLCAGPGAPEVIRPLLDAWRSDVDAYCVEHRLEPRLDVTNLDVRRRRSRVRLELMPLLDQYSPDVRRNLARLARQAAEERAILDANAEALLTASARPGPSPLQFGPWRPYAPAAPRLCLDRSVLAGCPPALARRALRRAIHRLAGPAVEVDAALLERGMAVVRGSLGALDLPGAHYRLAREGALVLLTAVSPEADSVDPVEVPVPGTLEVPALQLRLTAAPVPGVVDPHRGPNEAVLSAAALDPPLRLRTPRSGDRFHPLGAPGSSLLSDLFAGRKIPRAYRRTWPVIEDAEGIVWAPGLAVAERMRVRTGTGQCVELRIEDLVSGEGCVVTSEA